MDIYEEITSIAADAINPTLSQSDRDNALRSLNTIKELAENLQKRIEMGDMYLLSDLYQSEWVKNLE